MGVFTRPFRSVPFPLPSLSPLFYRSQSGPSNPAKTFGEVLLAALPQQGRMTFGSTRHVPPTLDMLEIHLLPTKTPKHPKTPC